jgi:hypothetical protein
LNRKRSLSIGMIRRLHDRLGISAEVLIRPSNKRECGVIIADTSPTSSESFCRVVDYPQPAPRCIQLPAM